MKIRATILGSRMNPVRTQEIFMVYLASEASTHVRQLINYRKLSGF